MSPEQQRAYDASTNQGDTGIPEKPGFFGNLWKGFKSDLSSSFSSPKKPTSHKSIPDDGGTTDMGGVKWNQLHSSGRKGVEAALWNIYGKHGKKPTFVSGLRDKNHKLYNPASQHAYGLAFDLRSKGLEFLSGESANFFVQWHGSLNMDFKLKRLDANKQITNINRQAVQKKIQGRLRTRFVGDCHETREKTSDTARAVGNEHRPYLD